jgi:hypothetical protein
MIRDTLVELVPGTYYNIANSASTRTRTLAHARDHFIMGWISRVLRAEMKRKFVQPMPDGFTSRYSAAMLEPRMAISGMLHNPVLEVRDVLAAFQAEKCWMTARARLPYRLVRTSFVRVCF